MYRNYDGNKSAFGDVSVAASGANPDNVAVFAAERTADGALTVMVLNKYLTGTTPVTLNLSGFEASGTVAAWQLTSANVIASLGTVGVFREQSDAVAAGTERDVVRVSEGRGPAAPTSASTTTSSDCQRTGQSVGDGIEDRRVTAVGRSSANETAFHVERRLSRQTWTRIATVAANVTAFFDGVGKGSYEYRVQAFDAVTGVTSSYSDTVTARVK